MIWNGWVLVLIIGQLAVVAINATAFINAVRIVRSWNTASLSAYQLDMEHRSELVSTIVSWSLLFQVFSLVVFEITARSLAPFIPGAMCTTGTLQAHPLGWPILFMKMGVLYLYGWWIVINYIDVHVEGFPLTRLKNWYAIGLFPVMLTDLMLQIAYFTGLDPSVISSCCGVVFEVGAEGFGSSVASLPPALMRVLLVGFTGLLIVSSPLLRRNSHPIGKIAYACGSFVGLIVGLAAVVAFVAPYVYLMPALHCPFIFLDQGHFNYGYCVYVPLFGASFLGTSLGILVGIGAWFPAARSTVEHMGDAFLRNAGMLWALFLICAYAPMVKFWIEAGVHADLFH